MLDYGDLTIQGAVDMSAQKLLKSDTALRQQICARQQILKSDSLDEITYVPKYNN